MKRTVFRVMAALALATVALAADVSGAWSGSYTFGDGANGGSAYAVVKQTGTSLTGAAGPSSDEQWPIEGGKVEGNKISFTVRAPDGAVYKVEAALEGDNLKGDITAGAGAEAIKGKIAFARVK
jgi:hypothetical protein